MKKKIKLIISTVICISMLTTAVFLGHRFVYPFELISTDIKISQFTDYDLVYYSENLANWRNDTYHINYQNKNFEFDLRSPEEYCIVSITTEFKNTGFLTMTPEYLTLKTDNDIIGFSTASLKYASVYPNESDKVFSRFICRRNGMTDSELKDFIVGLKFYLVQNDNILGEKCSKISLKKFA